jgi:hypothetical protein
MTYLLLLAGVVVLAWAIVAMAINAKSSTLAEAFSQFAGMAPQRRKPSAGRASEVESSYLRMSLDHRSGTMDGEVLQGAFAGARLGVLKLDDLLTLLAELQQHDSDGARLLAAWLDRSEHAETWREAAQKPGARHAHPTSGMTRQEAADILGIAPDAGAETIREAHRRLMAANHPDRGGSPWLARQINMARDTLLDE